MLPVVALVGRANVGKSTLFNRLTRTRDALVADFPGLTRDRKYGSVNFDGLEFIVVDTGGIDGNEQGIEVEMAEQSLKAIDEADVIMFVVDVEEGITPMDDEVAKLLRKITKPVIVVVNKVDNAMREKDAYEFYNLGLGNYITISSTSGSGTGELLDELINVFPNKPEPTQEELELPRFAVVGRPNAGK